MFFNFNLINIGDAVGFSPRESLLIGKRKQAMWMLGTVIKKTSASVRVKFKDDTEKTFTKYGYVYGESSDYSMTSIQAQLRDAKEVEEHNKEVAIHNARVSLNNHIRLKLEKITMLCKQSEGKQLRKINEAFDKIIKEAEDERSKNKSDS